MRRFMPGMPLLFLFLQGCSECSCRVEPERHSVAVIWDASGSTLPYADVISSTIVGIYSECGYPPKFTVIASNADEFRVWKPSVDTGLHGNSRALDSFLDSIIPHGADAVGSGLDAAMRELPTTVYLITDGYVDEPDDVVLFLRRTQNHSQFVLNTIEVCSLEDTRLELRGLSMEFRGRYRRVTIDK